MRWMRAFLSLLVAIGVMGHVASASALAQGADEKPTSTKVERAVAIVDGRERVVTRGSVVARGRRVGQSDRREDQGEAATCDIPETKYGLEGRGPDSAAMTLKVTDDCQLVVASIDVGAASPAGRRNYMSLPALATVKRQTGGWHDQYDCCGLLLTEAYAHIKYYDTGSTVYGAFGHYTYCHNARDGWYGTGSLWNWSNPSSSVWIWKRCSFAWINGSYKHTLDVDVYSYPGNGWQVYCSRYGSTVPGARFNCGKAHYNQI